MAQFNVNLDRRKLMTYNDVFSQDDKRRRYNIAFKTSWEIHSLVQEIVSATGQSFQAVCESLLSSGIEAHYETDSSNKNYSAARTLMKELRRVTKIRNIRQSLREIKGETENSKFISLCRSFGIDPDSIEATDPSVPNSKLIRCESFLKVLFTARPEGLLVNLVIEIGKREDFGEKTVRKAAEKVGLIQDWVTNEEGRKSFWFPPEGW
jgi:hypothetical protein